MLNKAALSKGLQAFCRAHNADSPESAMRIACASLLTSCDLGEPPIPLNPLLHKLGIRLQRMKGKRIKKEKQPDARLAARKDGLVAYLYEDDRNRNWRRARFSLAHEIGHALLIHTLGNPSLIVSLDETPDHYRQVEKLCDFAASELLMPPSSVRRALRKHDFSPGGLAGLYDSFLVSKEALARRLATIIPHASVVKWRVYSRAAEEPETMRVVGSYPGYNRGGSRPWLPSGCTTKHLDPPIVDWAASRNEVIAENDLRIILRGQSQECVGLATFFPVSRPSALQPSFEGFKIPDEQVKTSEIFLFAADKLMTGETTAWVFKQR
jgi:Zn-dependent peptidase ImmA (M78 family)